MAIVAGSFWLLIANNYPWSITTDCNNKSSNVQMCKQLANHCFSCLFYQKMYLEFPQKIQTIL